MNTINKKNTWTRLVIFLLLVFIALSAYAWRAKICFNPDELFYYKSSQTIAEVKNLFAPKYFDEHRFQKPPLFYSAVFLSYKLFGVNWLSARLVTIIASILVLLLLYLFGRKLFDKEKAFFATAFCGTSMLFLRFGRIVLPEMSLILFITGSFYFAYIAFTDNKRTSFYLSFLCMGIGTLIKGPIAFALPGAAILAFYITNKTKVPLSRPPWIRGCLIVFVAYFLWFIPAFIIHGKSLTTYFMTAEINDRLMDNAGFTNLWHGAWYYLKKIFFYVPILFAQYLPWSILAPIALFVTRKELDNTAYPMKRNFLLCWFWTGFLIFTLVPAKRAHYVLVLFPALSLYIVSFLNINLERTKKILTKFVSATLAVYIFTMIVLFPYIFTDGVDRLSERLVVLLEKENSPVAISWRLDPQEIELYIDKPSQRMGGSHFTNKSVARATVEQLISEAGSNKTIFYFLLAEEEANKYLKDFTSYTKDTGGKNLIFVELDSDLRWRKTIKFQDFCSNIIKDPSKIKDHFTDAFMEEVFLLGIQEK